MSRNRDRVGSASSGAQPTESPVNQMMNSNENNSFSFVVPTEFVEIPSRGKYYPPGHPLHNQPNVEIKQMTAKEEDILTSQSLLKQGVAVDRVLQSIMVDNRININSLLIGDKNALLVACRVSGYGSEYKTNVACPACEEKQDYHFDLNTATIHVGGDLSNVADNGNGTFTTTLPRSKFNATFRLLTSQDEKFMEQLKSKNKNKRDRLVSGYLRCILVAVEDNDSTDALNYVAENLPSMDAAHLRKCYQEVAPELDLKQYFECAHCDHSQDLEVPLNADFFWPDA